MKRTRLKDTPMVFDELPKSKKKQKTEKTPEQIEEELTAEQEALFAKLTRAQKETRRKSAEGLGRQH
jgi:hypothetical protein